MSRETVVILDTDEALHAGLTKAIADKHRLTQVRMSYSLHSLMVSQFTSRDDPVLLRIIDCYDPVQLKHIPIGDPSGVFYGVNVYRDETLQGAKLVLESEPFTAEQLAQSARR